MSKSIKILPPPPVLAFCLGIFISANVLAAPFSVKITSTKGAPVEDAVVSLLQKHRSVSPQTTQIKTAVMDQVDKQFVPHVLAVQVGTTVNFPNSDNIRHHVYSFSKAKLLDLKLYSMDEKKSAFFDKPGVVVLGCNIHDWMIGYIHVVDTPYFSKSNAKGEIVISNVPEGKYRMHVWHPRLKGDRQSTVRAIVILDSTPFKTDVKLLLKKKRKTRRTYTY